MFTYKEHKATGRYRSFESEYHDIKLHKKIVGSITETGHFSDNPGSFVVMFMVKKAPDARDPAPFKNVSLKKRFGSAVEAKKFLVDNFETVVSQLDLFNREED